MRELSLQNLIQRADELPEVPQIAFRAIELLNDPDTEVSHLAEVIASDQALTAKVLRLCNSAYYGLSRNVTTISEAVMIVGFSSVKSLVLMITTQSTLNKGLLGYKIGPGEFWRHSLCTAESARVLAQQIAYPKTEEGFIAGLIHDIGKMVLNQYALPEVYRATNLSQKEHIPIHQAEQRILGFDHAEAGASLAERWNFPAVLVDSIRFHHDLSQSLQQDQPLSFIVAIANLMAQFIEAPENRIWTELEASKQLEPLHLTITDLKGLLPEIERRVAKTREMILSVG